MRIKSRLAERAGKLQLHVSVPTEAEASKNLARKASAVENIDTIEPEALKIDLKVTPVDKSVSGIHEMRRQSRTRTGAPMVEAMVDRDIAAAVTGGAAKVTISSLQKNTLLPMTPSTAVKQKVMNFEWKSPKEAEPPRLDPSPRPQSDLKAEAEARELEEEEANLENTVARQEQERKKSKIVVQMLMEKSLERIARIGFVVNRLYCQTRPPKLSEYDETSNAVYYASLQKAPSLKGYDGYVC